MDMKEISSALKTNPHTAMRDYIRLREIRAEIAARDKELKAAQDRIAKTLFAMSVDQGVTGYKADDCTCYQQEKKQFSVKDASAFLDWVMENGHSEALHKRVNSDFAVSYMEQNDGQLPPGVHLEREMVMHVRSAGDKA